MAAARTCWDVLEIPVGSSLRDIKKAYRKKALETHPDRVSNNDDKAQAAVLFRQVHAAYQDALDQQQDVSDEEAGGPARRTRQQRRQKKRKKDDEQFHNVKECFHDVCNDIQRESEEQVANLKKEAKDLIVNAWPYKPETCWQNFIHFRCMLYQVEFLADFNLTRPDLFKFLSERRAKTRAKAAKEHTDAGDALVDEVVAKLRAEWTQSNNASLERWTASKVSATKLHS